MGASSKTVPKPQEKAFLFKDFKAAFEDMNLPFASQGFIVFISEVCHSGCFCLSEVEIKKEVNAKRFHLH